MTQRRERALWFEGRSDRATEEESAVRCGVVRVVKEIHWEQSIDQQDERDVWSVIRCVQVCVRVRCVCGEGGKHAKGEDHAS